MTASFATLTIGQAPRSDIMPLLSAYLPAERVRHVGLLDGLDIGQIAERYAPQQGDKLLVSRLLDGTQVTLGAARVESGLQEKICELEATGCEVILLLCTGEFGRLQAERVLLLEPDRIIPPLISAIVGTHRVGIVVPVAEQVGQQARKWRQLAAPPSYAVASPYLADDAALERRLAPCCGRGRRWWCSIVSVITSVTALFCRRVCRYRCCCRTYWSPSWPQS